MMREEEVVVAYYGYGYGVTTEFDLTDRLDHFSLQLSTRCVHFKMVKIF